MISILMKVSLPSKLSKTKQPGERERATQAHVQSHTCTHAHTTLLQLMVAIDYNEGIERSVRGKTGGGGGGAKNSTAYLQPHKA